MDNLICLKSDKTCFHSWWLQGLVFALQDRDAIIEFPLKDKLSVNQKISPIVHRCYIVKYRFWVLHRFCLRFARTFHPGPRDCEQGENCEVYQASLQG